MTVALFDIVEMRMGWEAKVTNLVRELGGAIEDVSAGYDNLYNVDAPRGKTWDGDLHSFVVAFPKTVLSEMKEGAWKDCYERLTWNGGKTVDCNHAECDYCRSDE